jgi:hypothetical protein
MFPDAFLAHSALHFDFSKTSKFIALIFQPPGLIAGGLFGGLIGQTKLTRVVAPFLNSAGLSFQCEQAVLPGYSLNTVDQRVFGSPFSIAAKPEDFAPLELQFICMADLWERKFFEDWMEFIVPKTSNRSSADKIVSTFIDRTLAAFDSDARISNAQGAPRYKDEYASSIQVLAFSETGIPTARYTFEECYPVSVAPQTVNWGDDAINRVNVTFKYTSWSREKNFISQVPAKLSFLTFYNQGDLTCYPKLIIRCMKSICTLSTARLSSAHF